MKTSVVIPTYNGAHKILDVLHSLELQTTLPDEVIVVVDGSTDGTCDLLKKEKINLSGFKILEQRNGGRATVRNNGAREAAGDLLLFADDDMILPAAWVNSHIEHHKNHPGSIVTGKIEDAHKFTGNDFQKFRAFLSDKWNSEISERNPAISFVLNYPYITANNFSIDKALFDLLKGFDERLTDAEDYDMARRAAVENIPLYYSEACFAWHNEILTGLSYIKRQRQYTWAQEKLLNLKPELYKNEHRYTVSLPSGLKGLIFKSICTSWWINSVDKQFWIFLPRKIRYKLYDLIITANGTMYPDKVQL